MTFLPYDPSTRRPPLQTTCSCCSELKSERGVMISIERADATIYRFICGGCIVSLVEAYVLDKVGASLAFPVGPPTSSPGEEEPPKSSPGEEVPR